LTRLPFEYRVAVVTGGGRGLGRAFAFRLAESGASVCIAGRDQEVLDGTAAELTSNGFEALALQADVSNPDDVEALKDRVESDLGRVSILVNNAGIAGPTAPIGEIDPGDWEQTVASNLRSAYLCSRAFVPAMVEDGHGDVVFVGSVAASRPLARRTPYCASKAALGGLTRSLALEVGRSGVRVNCLSPGPVEGARMDEVFEREAEATGTSVEQAREAYISKSAAHRLVTTEEVTDGLISILSSTGINGVEIDLSGGMFA
jgi:NAD(P)-dependent dehydrogenase (short-subunit alcohol dehydrogenase family)